MGNNASKGVSKKKSKASLASDDHDDPHPSTNGNGTGPPSSSSSGAGTAASGGASSGGSGGNGGGDNGAAPRLAVNGTSIAPSSNLDLIPSRTPSVSSASQAATLGQSSASSLNPNSSSATSQHEIPTTQTILANPIPQSLANSLAPSTTSSSSAPIAAASSSAPGTSLSSTNGGNGGGVSGFLSTSPASPTKPQTFDIDDMIARLLDTGYSAKITKSVCLKNAEITAICQAAREVFLAQPTLIELSPPVKIVGDVHGQYSDLIRLFEMCGFPPSANYLFLGDYVDRGKQSLETILLLLCYKIKYPENFFLLRGNHECANVTRVYGFYDECKRRCNIKIWKTFIDVFNCLPIAAVVAQKIFALHGGLSPSLSSMDDIRRISRPTDVPDYGLLNDLLWSDPSDTALDWEDNERGVSYCFGKTVIAAFLARYDFDLICRAHMVVEDGYEFWNERTLVTIFSAPNYCGEFDNFGAVMSVSEDLLCAFELLKPLDQSQLKKELLKSRRRLSAAPAAGTPQ
ncbi:hypothetical protein RQP46_003325 [Phenoliferia psychrophenolica]